MIRLLCEEAQRLKECIHHFLQGSNVCSNVRTYSLAGVQSSPSRCWASSWRIALRSRSSAWPRLNGSVLKYSSIGSSIKTERRGPLDFAKTRRTVRHGQSRCISFRESAFFVIRTVIGRPRRRGRSGGCLTLIGLSASAIANYPGQRFTLRNGILVIGQYPAKEE
jgi:hypothetical protein